MATIRRLHPGEGLLFREIRLAALKEAPYAFGATYEPALARTAESWSEQADGTCSGGTRATFLAFDQNKPIGIAALYQDNEDEENAEVLQVWISPEQRGSGLARKLIGTVFEWAMQNGYKNVLATVTTNNERAQKFYLNYGFEKVSESDSETILRKATSL
jgi:ribosomal protein S18 acetylase RimI-like enzyme